MLLSTCANCGSQAKAGRRQENGAFWCWLCEWLIKGAHMPQLTRDVLHCTLVLTRIIWFGSTVAVILIGALKGIL